MKITCISASNIEPARGHSASTRTCELIREIAVEESGPEVQVELLPLIDYEMKPCRMCGQCLPVGMCVRDEAFNRIYAQIQAADALFVVCPHYAPLPSKLMMLLEKLQEIWYLSWCQDHAYRAPYAGLPLGLVAHGGQTAEALPYYKRALLDPLAAAFGSVQMQVVGVDETWPNGAVFAIQGMSQPDDSIFVNMEHDWPAIRASVKPLVKNVLEKARLQAHPGAPVQN